jgi:flagellin-like hook-associated protein FlgL
MSSILTNNSAMVALQTLRNINSNLQKTQGEISTGKSVATAKDSAAVWAISKVMESDVSGFKAISDSLSLGRSTIATARSAAGQVTDLLQEMKTKIVASQEDNVDRTKLQDELVSLRNQIGSITSAAQFNGLNLLSNDKNTTAYTAAGNVDGSGTTSVLSSLDRSGSGVTASSIDFLKQDLRQTAAGGAGALVLAAAAMTAAGTATANGAGTATYTISGEAATAGRTKTVMAGDRYDFDMSIFNAGVPGTPFTGTRAVYVAKDGDTTADIARGLSEMVNFRLAQQGFESEYTVSSEQQRHERGQQHRHRAWGGGGRRHGTDRWRYHRWRARDHGRVQHRNREWRQGGTLGHRGADPDLDPGRRVLRHRRKAAGYPERVRDQPDGLFEIRHRLAGGCRHGGGLGPAPGPAGSAAAGHPGALDRQPGAAEHPGTVPLIPMTGARMAGSGLR